MRAEVQREEYRFNHEMIPGLISIILPSRNRSDLLQKSVNTLMDNMFIREHAEVLVAYDNDDLNTKQTTLYKVKGMAINTGPRRGWKGLHLYYADLIRHSMGEWIFMWGDDGLMHTTDWDLIVRRQKPGVLHVQGGPANGHNVFPIVHRYAIEGVRYVIPSPHTDTWWTEVAAGAGCLHQVPINITEDRFNVTGNNNDQTFQEGSIHQYRPQEYYGQKFSAERQNDMFRLAEACASWSTHR